MNVGDLKNVALSHKEIAKYAPKVGLSNLPKLQLYIPMLFLDQSIGLPKISPPVALNSSFIINDKACKPSIAKTYKTQNYVTVPVHQNSLFKQNYFHQGDEISIEIIHDDIDNIYITNTVDNSTSTP